MTTSRSFTAGPPPISSNKTHAGVGANMVANAWGAVIGAKVIKYRTAVLVGIACQIVGVLVFGPRVASVYNGILYDWTKLKPYPGLTLYALMWTEVTLVIWQFLALWKQILIPIYLGTGMDIWCQLPLGTAVDAPVALSNFPTGYQPCVPLH